jgi:hypothetical protein
MVGNCYSSFIAFSRKVMKKVGTILLIVLSLPALVIGLILLGIINAIFVGYPKHDYDEWR